MDFGILGPVEARDGAVRLELGGVRGQKVLAALLLAPDRVVPLTHLVDVVWDGEPPSTARHQIQKSVGDLRVTLGAPASIVTDGPGYRLVLGSAGLDAVTFERHVAAARDAEPAEAVRVLREALALWRGPALEGLTSGALQAEAQRLDERRIAVAQQCFAMQLELGQHAQVVTDLSVLVAANPLREQLVEQLMTALHRSDRQADALELYERTRRLLASGLGVEPGHGLRKAHQAILSRQRSPAPDAPAQLPARPAVFVGRGACVDELDASAFAVVTGGPGVGKTALAVHWAHRVRDRFPDGQLYANLRAHDDSPAATVTDVLAQFLRALGAARIPVDAGERAGLFRSVLADRRVLIVLDDAASEDQVRPLLPGTPGCAVVVTSRNHLRGLTALDDAHPVELGLLPPDEAHALITRLTGGEPDAVAELAAVCGYLPLAIRIAVANLGPDRITDAVADLVRGNRVALLAINGDRRAAVTGAFERSVRALPADAAKLFRQLGSLPGNDFTARTASGLMGVDDVRGPLSSLESASLIEAHGGGRYRVPGLLHAYARSLCEIETD
ncbi:AfsR/SARP family transcriptional regulator [Lentzea sp. NBRC 102530]|uniref:AfsR/SARP family transcriptional regulator n=1 Tax=Lentzea sp. NBRC 102530 TaxID=3032201 RepID=UPI0024A3A123|nr:AfsR/SARP family transcriptional regulator [Lentzea sp. NBRC 102530]GLY48763.1 hypothetical protein Lesp01_24190 [Lentzea sp. NBRC 102530]